MSVGVVVYRLALWCTGCSCGVSVGAVVYRLERWCIGWSCGVLVGAVVYRLELWCIGCSCGVSVGAVVYSLEQLLCSQHDAWAKFLCQFTTKTLKMVFIILSTKQKGLKKAGTFVCCVLGQGVQRHVSIVFVANRCQDRDVYPL